MLYAKILLGAFVLLAAIYYGMLIGHLFGKWKITRRQITFARMCVPFYYWIVSQHYKPTKITNNND